MSTLAWVIDRFQNAVEHKKQLYLRTKLVDDGLKQFHQWLMKVKAEGNLDHYPEYLIR